MRITIIPDNEDDMHAWAAQGESLLQNIEKDITKVVEVGSDQANTL